MPTLRIHGPHFEQRPGTRLIHPCVSNPVNAVERALNNYLLKKNISILHTKAVELSVQNRALRGGKGGFWIPNTLLLISKAWWTESTESLPGGTQLGTTAGFGSKLLRGHPTVKKEGWETQWQVKSEWMPKKGSLQTACFRGQAPEGVPEQQGQFLHLPGQCLRNGSLRWGQPHGAEPPERT